MPIKLPLVTELTPLLDRPILITGAGGMLGWDFGETFRTLGLRNFILLNHQKLDVTDPTQIEAAFEKFRPGLVINCAAYTNVDGAETEESKARALNSEAVRHLVASSQKFGAKLIHFSTDQVFDGASKVPQMETDSPNPINIYAQTKWEGEKEALCVSENLVIRVQWLYGIRKNRFSSLRSASVFHPFSDLFGAPTWTRDVTAATLKLAALGAKGLVHFSYDTWASWAEVFTYVKDHWNLSVELVPQKASELKLPARRPAFCVLSNARLKRELGISAVGNWEESMEGFLSLLEREPGAFLPPTLDRHATQQPTLS